jgi:hypothetical protein
MRWVVVSVTTGPSHFGAHACATRLYHAYAQVGVGVQ